MNSKKHVALITLLIFLTGIFTSAGTALHNHDVTVKNTMELLQVKNAAISNLIEKHIDDYISVAYNISAFFASSQNVSYDEWNEFIKQSDIASRYHGALSISYIKFIAPESIDSEIRNQKNIYGGFDIYPKDYKNQYCIVYFESWLGNPHHTRGLNRCANPIIRDALFKSKSSGKAQFTHGSVKQTDNDNTDVILTYPIQQNGTFIGWVGISINLPDMFESIFTLFGNNLESDYEIFQLDQNDNKEYLVFDYDNHIEPTEYAINNSEKMNYYADRISSESKHNTHNLRWSIVSNVQKEFDHRSWLIFGIGSIITLLLSVIQYLFMSQKITAREIVRDLRASHDKSEERLQKLMNLAPVGIYQTDASGQCIYANPQWLQITGLKANEAMGTGWAKAIHPDDKEEVFANWHKSVQAQSPFAMDFRFQSHNNNTVWVSSQAVPIIWNNELQGYVGTITNISARKESENALLSSRDKFQMLFYSATDAMLMAKFDGTVIDCNKSAVTLFNIFAKEDLVGNTVDCLFAKNSKSVQEFNDFIARIKTQSEVKQEWSFIRSDMITIYCDVSMKRLKLVGEDCVIITLHDLTIHKRMQQELKKASLQLDLAIEGANDGLWDWDIANHAVYYSPRWKEQLGYNDEELENSFQTWESRVHPDDLPFAKQQVAATFESKSSQYICEHRLKHHNGTWRWILARGRCAYDADGNPLRMVGFHTDITDIKNIIEQQKTDHQLLIDSIENIDAGFALFDKNQKLVMGNSLYRKMYNLPSDMLVPGTDYKDILAYKAKNGIKIPDNMTESEWISQRLNQHHKPSRPFDEYYFNNKVIRVTDRHTVENYTVCMHNDITVLKEQSILLNAAKDAAEAANTAKSDFLATMSHEIRTPMNGIIGMTDIVMNTALNPEQREFIRTIKNSAQTLLTIINDILDFSKLESGKLQFEYINFALSDTISKVQSLMQNTAEAKGIQLNIEIDPRCPNNLISDPTRIQQVLFNLIGNGIKFTQKGYVTLRVQCISTTEKDAQLRFAVEDTGIGIPQQHLGHLFERFSQSDKSINRKFGGTGLGLWICKQIVEKLGGRIGVNSEMGKGSQFWFEIPFEVSNETANKKSANQDTDVLAKSPAADRSLAILVAEDNKVNQMVISAILKKMGHRIDIANNGVEALDMLQKNNYDIVLMDIQMPEKDGMEATREIRTWNNEKSKVPVIAITANAMKGDRENYLNCGMTDYISKPINVDELKRILNEHAKLAI